MFTVLHVNVYGMGAGGINLWILWEILVGLPRPPPQQTIHDEEVGESLTEF